MRLVTPALPRRSAAAAVIATAVESVTPAPDARLRTASRRAQRAARVAAAKAVDAAIDAEEPADPRVVDTVVAETAPSAAQVDRAYAPRAAVPSTSPVSRTSTRSRTTSTTPAPAAQHLVMHNGAIEKDCAQISLSKFCKDGLYM
jgi:hypothetical protein